MGRQLQEPARDFRVIVEVRVVFGAFLVGVWRFRRAPFLVALSLPALTLVTLQSVLQDSNANWAAASYFAGSVLAVGVLSNHRIWRGVGVASNAALSLALPLLTVYPTFGFGHKPLLSRYVGRAEVSQKIVQLAHQHGLGTVVANNRDVLADLFYTGQSSGLGFYTPRPTGAAANYYEQTYPMPLTMAGPILLISDTPPACAAQLVQRDLGAAAYCTRPMAAYILPAQCARDLPASAGCK